MNEQLQQFCECAGYSAHIRFCFNEKSSEQGESAFSDTHTFLGSVPILKDLMAGDKSSMDVTLAFMPHGIACLEELPPTATRILTECFKLHLKKTRGIPSNELNFWNFSMVGEAG